ncbi:MAG: YhdP family protein [Pseudomonadota bacterium]
MSTAKQYLRTFRRILWYSLAALVVILAVLVSLFRIFLPDLTAYRSELEELASAFLDHTVRIESMDARLVGFTPTLIFDDVYMLDKTGEREIVRFDQARLGVALIDSVRQRQVVPRDFTIDGIQLAITRQQDGRFLLQGVNVSNLEKTFQTGRPHGSGELANWLFKRSRLSLRNSTIIWKDLKQDGNTLRFDDVNLVLRNDNQRHQLNGKIKLPARMGKHFEIAMDVRGDILNPRKMKGDIYLRGDAVQLDQWGVKPEYQGVSLNSGTADFQLWGTWEDNAIAQLSGDLTAYDLDMSLPIMDDSYHVRLMGGLFDVDNHTDGWTLNVDRFQYMSAGDVWPQTRFSIRHTAGDKIRAAEWQIDSDYFRIEDVAGLLLQSNLPDDRQREFLQSVKPVGDVQRLHFRHTRNAQQEPRYRLQVDFEHLSSEPWRDFPGVTGLQGQLYTDHRQGRAEVYSGYASVDAPRLFREPLMLNRLDSRLRWSRDEQGWQLQSEQLQMETDHIQLAADLLLSLPQDHSVSPYLDLQAQFKNGKVEHASRYFPTGIMKQPLVNWLDRSIVSGHVSEGGLVFNGRLRDFPFRDQRGQFKVDLDARDVRLNYREGWPAITGIDLSATFTSQRMEILTRQGRLFDTRLSPSRARIASFRNPRLQLQVDANGKLSDVARFLTRSPIAPGGSRFIEQSRIEGTANTRFEAWIPLSSQMQEQAPTRYQGKITLRNGQLYLLDEKLAMQSIEGEVNFDQAGVRSRALQAQLLDEPVTLELDTTGQSESSRQISILAHGRINAPQLAERLAPRWLHRVSGTTSWHAAVILGGDKNATQQPLLRIDSTLYGISSDLPAPLNKSTTEAMRLLFEVRFGAERNNVSLNLAERLSTRFELSERDGLTQLERGSVHFGAAASAALPSEQILLIGGTLDGVDPGQWRQILRSAKVSGDDSARAWQLPIRFDMERLTLARPEQPEQPEQVKPSTPAKSSSNSPPPTNLPGIRGRIEQFQYGDYPLGHLDFELHSLSKGVRLQRLRLRGENLRLQASGDWWYEMGRHSTQLNYDLISPNLGQLLDNLGFAAIIGDGELKSRGELHWRAPPLGFKPGLLTGEISVHVQDGSLVNVNPGAGRLLGLFSLSALPRRLMLDFSDTFQEGFHFDNMEGEFELRDGNSYNDALKIDAPGAKILIQGRTGLAERDFDQRMTVIPQVGNTLPVASGLLFGTQVGAAILFLEKLFGGGLDKATAKRYHITGSWEEPVITPLDNTSK